MARSRNRKKKKSRAKQSTVSSINIGPFKKQLLRFLTAIDAPVVMDLLTQQEFIFLFLTRIRPFEILIENPEMFPPNAKVILREMLQSILCESKMKGPTGKEFSYLDGLTIGRYLHFLFFTKTENKSMHDLFLNFELIRKKLKPWSDEIEDEKTKGDTFFKNQIIKVALMIQMGVNTLSGSMISISIIRKKYQVPKTFTTVDDYSRVSRSVSNQLSFRTTPREALKFWDESKVYSGRRAVRAGMPSLFHDIQYDAIKYSALYYNDKRKTINSDKEYEVYIQYHAINRIKERLDCISTGVAEHGVSESFNKLDRAIKLRDQSYLIPFWVQGVKLGYLVGNVINMEEDEPDFFLVRTFLFLTNQGTPEGNKLQSLLGFTKYDIQYLGLGKLSSFTRGDLQENSELMDIFRQTGCDVLFSYTTKSYGYTYEDIDGNTFQQKHNYDLVTNYINNKKNLEADMDWP